MHDGARIRKAVIPAAGLGTRLLPFTKTLPKEVIPIANKPLIQYAVEEAAASGIEEVVLVTRDGRCELERYFSRDHPLEQLLELQGKDEQVQLIRRLSSLAKITTARQNRPLGLAHAVSCARYLLDGEPFAMILPDAIIEASTPCLRQLMNCYDSRPGCYVATREVSPDEVHRFGILDVATVEDSQWSGRLFHVHSCLEKPSPGTAPSFYGIFGRYLFQPDIFDAIDRTPPGTGGEIQITDSLALYSQQRAVYGLLFEGIHYDAGGKLGLLQATVGYGLKDPDVGPQFRRYLSTLERS